MNIPYCKTFVSALKFFILWPWPPTLIYFWKKNLTVALTVERDAASIICIGISCGEAFLSILNFFFIPWPWPPTLTFICKNLKLALTFKPKEILRDSKKWGGGGGILVQIHGIPICVRILLPMGGLKYHGKTVREFYIPRAVVNTLHRTSRSFNCSIK